MAEGASARAGRALTPGTRVVVTGGLGFIGSALVLQLVAEGQDVTVIDKETYAANRRWLAALDGNPRYSLLHADVADGPAMRAALVAARPEVVFHLAAESHVDRSIDRPAEFIHTNILGTVSLAEAALAYWRGLGPARQASFRFMHISTDEVFGSLGQTGVFTESSPYRPNSPYSASKAASDHLIRVWGSNYGLPVTVTNCSNNYGPRQHPEKLIPKTILNALDGAPIPIYAQGRNIRDWLHVEDHVEGLIRAWTLGQPGETYAFGGHAEVENITLARKLCEILDRLRPGTAPYADLITFVADRPMHDFRYAIDATKAQRDLGWRPERSLQQGLETTVAWYLHHSDTGAFAP